MKIEEHKAETVVDAEALNRALDLLARWALRRGQKVLGGGVMNQQNRVTAYGIKGYGAQNESN